MYTLREVGEHGRREYKFETYEAAWTEFERLAENDKEKCKMFEACEIRHDQDSYSRVTLGEVQDWYILEIEEK